jgi:hypothetical protein
MKMKLEYAQKLLDGDYVFYNRYLSCHNNLLVVVNDEDSEYGYPIMYYGTQLDADGSFIVDDKGFVQFTRVKPVIDRDTVFALS